MAKTGLAILKNGTKYLKSGGRVLYSTCTINKNENEEVVKRFLQENGDFSVVDKENPFGKTLFPHIDRCDGFFYCVMKKK